MNNLTAMLLILLGNVLCGAELIDSFLTNIKENGVEKAFKSLGKEHLWLEADLASTGGKTARLIYDKLSMAKSASKIGTTLWGDSRQEFVLLDHETNPVLIKFYIENRGGEKIIDASSFDLVKDNVAKPFTPFLPLMSDSTEMEAVDKDILKVLDAKYDPGINGFRNELVKFRDADADNFKQYLKRYESDFGETVGVSVAKKIKVSDRINSYVVKKSFKNRSVYFCLTTIRMKAPELASISLIETAVLDSLFSKK